MPQHVEIFDVIRPYRMAQNRNKELAESERKKGKKKDAVRIGRKRKSVRPAFDNSWDLHGKIVDDLLLHTVERNECKKRTKE